ncbi:MAG TPA: 30S ribosomal protein S7, partial [archaeon]|nr:30S ribosomal protein S7 [archaeon]
KNKKSVERALADEILLAAKEDAQSFAIKRRNEIERMAKAAR